MEYLLCLLTSEGPESQLELDTQLRFTKGKSPRTIKYILFFFHAREFFVSGLMVENHLKDSCAFMDWVYIISSVKYFFNHPVDIFFPMINTFLRIS